MTDYDFGEPTSIPTDRELRDHHEAMWAALDPSLRDAAVALLSALPEAFLAEVRAMHAADPLGWAIPFHFGSGMAVRNYLRSGEWGAFKSGLPGILDERLPSGNWDDYYVAALERAAGVAA